LAKSNRRVDEIRLENRPDRLPPHWNSATVLRHGMNKERERYYLLPGMGGSAMRRKRNMMLRWSLLAGLLVSAALAWGLYLLQSLARRGGG
jgi:hypothetical protein